MGNLLDVCVKNFFYRLFLPDTTEAVSELGSVRAATEKVVRKWRIMGYSKWPNNKFEIKSPTFMSSGSIEWCLILCNTGKNMLSLHFHLLSANKNPMVKGTVSISLISEKGAKVKMYQETNVKLNEARTICTICLNDFLFKVPGLEDMFIIESNVNITTVVAETYRSVAPHCELGSLPDALGALLESGELSDIELVAGDMKLRAHRALLSARSPVFAAMLRHDTQEAQTGVVEIPDMDARTLKELLRFIYTGRAPCVKGMALQLLAAGDKYDLPDLKAICEEQLVQRLTVKTAAATAVFALNHASDQLKKTVINFIKINFFLVLGSDGWDEAIMQHPESIREIIRLVADKTVRA